MWGRASRSAETPAVELRSSTTWKEPMMVGTRAEIAPSDLIAEAIEHCVFPLAAVEDVQRDGPTVYVRGEGVRITDINGREYLDMMSSHTRANSLGYGNAE